MPRILVVDDDDQLRRLIETALRRQGFEVETASSAADGLERARRSPPSLVLSDIHMEGMDGYGVLDSLRSDPLTSAIPVILMTGAADDHGMRRAMEMGADDFLEKPFSTVELLKSVEARLQKQKKLEARANKRLEALRQTLSASLSHELRTPLSAILGYASILVEDDLLTLEELPDIGRAIHKSGKRLERLVETYLAYAETELLESDPVRLERLRSTAPEDLEPLVERAATLVAARHDRASDLTLRLSPAVARLSHDHAHRIVDELTDNAFKFSAAGKPVVVELDTSEAHVLFRVIDQGRGLTAEEVSSVGAWAQFGRRFYEQQGSGLGLALSRRLCELAGGSLDITSEPDHGTSVTARLPRTEPA